MALRVYDMQAGIAGQLPQGPEVIRRVVEVLGAAREGGFPVFFSRHVSLPKVFRGPSLAPAAHPHCWGRRVWAHWRGSRP